MSHSINRIFHLPNCFFYDESRFTGNLCPQQMTQSELETIKDSAAKVKNHRSFQEGDEVSVYDRGKILEIMGRNNFLVESDNGTKHISGNIMTKISDDLNRPLGGSINEENREDLESIYSEDFEDVITPLNNADPYGNTLRFRRSRRREIDQLDQSGASLPRLRSGRQ